MFSFRNPFFALLMVVIAVGCGLAGEFWIRRSTSSVQSKANDHPATPLEGD